MILDWLKFVSVPTLPGLCSSRPWPTFRKHHFCISLKVLFLLSVISPPSALPSDPQTEEETDRAGAGGAAAGPSCCQGLAAGSWGGSRHLVCTGPAQLVQPLTGKRGFLRHRSVWPVISLLPAETERDAVKAIHLSGAGASPVSLMNNGHFAHREALI